MLIQGKKLLKNLHEALDSRLRPLCLLPLEEILRQGLLHKSAALLLKDRRGKFLLADDPEKGFDFPFYKALPAGLDAGEFAEENALAIWRTRKTALIGRIQPCFESRNSLVFIFSASISNAAADMADRGRFILADSAEIFSLISFGCAFAPALRLFLEEWRGKGGI